MLYPLLFQPIFKDRIWGGRELERLYGKAIPAGQPTGESWEISDRPGDASVVTNGPLAGKNLRWLMEHHATEVLGSARLSVDGRFPLLCKILDAREKLSLQVHPPADKAKQLKGEPKTEMWYVVDAAPNASLYVGLNRSVTRSEFEKRIADGSVAECFYRIPVKAGDTMFLPSGRVHAIGDGLVIFEIQQNSDTTYRVFDWNRVGLDGKPRELHVAQSLASIDFNDFEPQLVSNPFVQGLNFKSRALVEHDLFNVNEVHVDNPAQVVLGTQKLRIIALIKGAATIQAGATGVALKPGDFCLVPASLTDVKIAVRHAAAWLCVEAN